MRGLTGGEGGGEERTGWENGWMSGKRRGDERRRDKQVSLPEVVTGTGRVGRVGGRQG